MVSGVRKRDKINFKCSERKKNQSYPVYSFVEIFRFMDIRFNSA
jgi:hypothetical protein